MYRVIDEGEWIKKCVQNSTNQMLGDTVLDQIEKKCGSLPLLNARACAQELGMELPEPGRKKEIQKGLPEQGPTATWIDSRPAEDCDRKATEQYIKTGIFDEKGYTECLMGTKLFNDVTAFEVAQEKEAAIKQKQKERSELTVWGKFALKIGVDIVERHSEFNDAFQTWQEKKDPSHSSTGTIDRGWREGLRIALTTQPGLTRIPGTNILFSGTLFGVSVYDDMVYNFSFTRQEQNYSFDKESFVPPDDTVEWSFINFELQIPFFERNFLEIKTGIKEDLLWWKQTNENLLFIPLNVQIGMNYQLQGNPISISERVLDVRDMAYILSSYTMFGLSLGLADVDLHPILKAAEFCNQVSDECSESYQEVVHDPNDPYLGTDSVYSGGYFFPYFDNTKADSATVGSYETAGRFYSSFEIKLTPHIFGEQRWQSGAMTYRADLDWYPLWKKVELSANVSLSFYLGPAMEWFVEGKGRNLWSTGDDNNVLLPDAAHEIRVFTGLGFRPSQVF
jgi:hypothetical protein